MTSRKIRPDPDGECDTCPLYDPRYGCTSVPLMACFPHGTFPADGSPADADRLAERMDAYATRER